MEYYNYQLDDELKVMEYPAGYKQVDISRRVRAPSESLRNHINAFRQFRDNTKTLLTEFLSEIDRQQTEINAQIKHGEFFLKDSQRFHWDANPMFDRLRLLYTSSIDALKREKRQLQREKTKQRMAFMKELLDANKELSPFTKLF
jgi:hypothetical protein